MIRPRFSIRLLLIVVSISAIACYWLFVRPTVLAERFVVAIRDRDLKKAKSLFVADSPDVLADDKSRGGAGTVVDMDADLLPREWNEIWKRQRRITLNSVFYKDGDKTNGTWTQQAEIVVTANGLR